MNHLSPEPRPDKDGKVVTRWVRNGTTPAAKPMPAPKVSQPEKQTATPETMRDFKNYLRDYGITAKFTENMTRMIASMSAETAENLVNELHYDYFALGNPTEVHRMIDFVYGPFSRISSEHRDTVFTNLRSIIPEYGMVDEDAEIIPKTRIVFDAIDGKAITRPFTDDEKTAYQSAACIIVALEIKPHTDKDTLAQAGLIRNGRGKLMLKDRSAIDAMLANVSNVEPVREELIKRQVFSAPLIHEIAANGIMSEGSL